MEQLPGTSSRVVAESAMRRSGRQQCGEFRTKQFGAPAAQHAGRLGTAHQLFDIATCGQHRRGEIVFLRHAAHRFHQAFAERILLGGGRRLPLPDEQRLGAPALLDAVENAVTPALARAVFEPADRGQFGVFLGCQSRELEQHLIA